MKRIAFLCMLFVLGAHLLSEVCAQGTEGGAADTTYGTYDKESNTFTIKKEFLGKKIPMRAIADACKITYSLYGDYDEKTGTQFGGAGKNNEGNQYFEIHYNQLQPEHQAKVVCDSSKSLMLDLTEVEDTAFTAILCFLGTKEEIGKGFVPDSTKIKDVSLAVESNPTQGGDGINNEGKPNGDQVEKPKSSNVLVGVNTLLLLILLILQFVRKGKSQLPKAQQVPSSSAASMQQPQPFVSSNRNPEYQQILAELGALKQQVEFLQQGIQPMHVQQQQQHVPQQQQHVQPLPPTPPSPQPTPEEVFDKVRYVSDKRCFLTSENSSSIIRVVKKGNDIRFTLKDEARQGILSTLNTYDGCIVIAGNTASPTQLDKVTPGKLRQDGNCYVVVEPIILHYL